MPALAAGNKEYFQETALLLTALRKSDIVVCFVDEYNMSEQDAHLYNWTLKG